MGMATVLIVLHNCDGYIHIYAVFTRRHKGIWHRSKQICLVGIVIVGASFFTGKTQTKTCSISGTKLCGVVARAVDDSNTPDWP